jgi:hypothetical protein
LARITKLDHCRKLIFCFNLMSPTLKADTLSQISIEYSIPSHPSMEWP